MAYLTCGSLLATDAKFCHKCGISVGSTLRAVFCPRCGKLNGAGAERCQACAVSLVSLVTLGQVFSTCPNCKTGISFEAYYCHGCGRQLRAGSPQRLASSVGQFASQSGAQAVPRRDAVADERALAAARRSYTSPAVLVLLLYFAVWVPGFIVNVVYLVAAERDEKLTGQVPEGKGCLTSLFVVFVALPACFLILAVVWALFVNATRH